MVKAMIALRVALGAIFVAAGALKLGDPLAFARVIDAYAILPERLVTLVAAVLPWIEIAAGGALIVGRWSTGGALVVLALLAAFLVVAGVTLARGLDPECGCFGPGSRRVGAGLIVQDVILGIAAGILVKKP
jgi:uncharacterized membrane protein YphA (DoxX/SURF4 family)